MTKYFPFASPSTLSERIDDTICVFSDYQRALLGAKGELRQIQVPVRHRILYYDVLELSEGSKLTVYVGHMSDNSLTTTQALEEIDLFLNRLQRVITERTYMIRDQQRRHKMTFLIRKRAIAAGRYFIFLKYICYSRLIRK